MWLSHLRMKLHRAMRGRVVLSRMSSCSVLCLFVTSSVYFLLTPRSDKLTDSSTAWGGLYLEGGGRKL